MAAADAPFQRLPAVRPTPATGFGAIGVRRLLEGAATLLLVLFIFFICFTFLKPSPYDFAAIPAMALWLCLGIRFHRALIPFVALLLLYHLGLVLALLPYTNEPGPVDWTVQSLYLMITAIFFAMLFAEDTERRVEIALKAYLASCLFAAAAGIAAYFELFGKGILFTMDGRAAGVFEDPNVLGSFLVPGALYLIHNLVTGRSRNRLLVGVALLLVLTGIFLSFSRGSWGATVIASATMIVMAYRTPRSAALRRRILRLGIVTAILGGVAVVGLLSLDNVAERFEDRAVATKDYDEGETGRFGNQLRAVPMLVERPLGFGPLRFRRTFGLEPHNSYLGGFANGGWLGGFAFLGLVLTTSFVGFRLCFAPSPFQRQAQIVWPGLMIFFLQSFQIDVDHWRHVFLLFGMVWGMEAARWAWRAHNTGAPGSAREVAAPRAA